MRVKDFEKIVSAIEAMDQQFPEMKPGTDIRIAKYRRLLAETKVGCRALQSMD
jgi:hypothetical protein